ncbi:MAG: LacI family DNA-binding transcriptional regulator [Ignavibacteriaceae bacterium]
MSITIKEIAERANVSIATVSRALNNDKNVRPKTRQTILSVAKDLDYKPNILARSLAKNKSNIIGVVLPDVDGEFFSEIVHGVDEVAYSGGFHTIVASSHSRRSIVESMIRFMGESLVRGIIIIAPTISEQIRDILLSSRIPILIINSKSDQLGHDSVSIDNFQGAYSMTEYLINCGYKNIAHIKGPYNNDDAIQRTQGFNAALKKYNIPIHSEWMINGEFTAQSGKDGCRRLLTMSSRPEVIFAANDMMALGCYKAIRSFGLKIPEDIGVAGFDDIFISQFLTPRLTTVHVPISEIGKTAATSLLDRIENRNGDNSVNIKNLKISTGLVIGGSCNTINN